jgi:hypothetical protein
MKHSSGLAGKGAVPIESITARIVVVRGAKVLLDADLAALYGVQTRARVQAIKRNLDRFPGDFMFRLSSQEAMRLRSQDVISSSSHGGRRYPPYAFTEQGVAMLFFGAQQHTGRSREHRDHACVRQVAGDTRHEQGTGAQVRGLGTTGRLAR